MTTADLSKIDLFFPDLSIFNDLPLVILPFEFFLFPTVFKLEFERYFCLLFFRVVDRLISAPLVSVFFLCNLFSLNYLFFSFLAVKLLELFVFYLYILFLGFEL